MDNSCMKNESYSDNGDENCAFIQFQIRNVNFRGAPYSYGHKFKK